MNLLEMVEASREHAREHRVPRRVPPVREPLEHPQVMAPGANVIANRPWHVERRRKLVQSRSPTYLADLKRANEIVKSRTTLLQAKKRGR